MATQPASETRIVAEVTEDVAAGDAGRIARKLGGIVANDDQVREAINRALQEPPEADDDPPVRNVLKAGAALLQE